MVENNLRREAKRKVAVAYFLGRWSLTPVRVVRGIFLGQAIDGNVIVY